MTPKLSRIRSWKVLWVGPIKLAMSKPGWSRAELVSIAKGWDASWGERPIQIGESCFCGECLSKAGASTFLRVRVKSGGTERKVIPQVGPTKKDDNDTSPSAVLHALKLCSCAAPAANRFDQQPDFQVINTMCFETQVPGLEDQSQCSDQFSQIH